MYEELNLTVSVEEIIDTLVYEITPLRHTFIVTYGTTYSGHEQPRSSNEHKRLGLFDHTDIPALHMPDPYKQSIHAWQRTLKER